MNFMSLLLILAGFVLLVLGGEYLVRSSVALSFRLKLSKLVIGMTVVSFATSAPELLVSLQAAMNGVSDIALGNVIGSNIANIGLVLGITAIITPLYVSQEFYKYNWPMMMLMSLALYVFLKNDAQLSTAEGAGLLATLLVFIVILIRKSRSQNVHLNSEEVDENLSRVSSIKITIWLLIGSASLYFGSEWLVKGAVDLATSLGISEYAVSVTVIAVGTSIPELAASVIAAVKKEKAISLGNLIGSNIFNIGFVLGSTAIIGDIPVDSPVILKTNLFWMIGFACILMPLVFIPKRYRISRYKGLILFLSYIFFVFTIVT
jgi:cation:H+ antiporter